MAKTLLLVDDDETIRSSLRDRLESEGFRVRTACNGRDALEQLELEKPACVILDLMMPVMNGSEFLTAIRRDRRFTNLHVVVMSAWLSSRTTDLARAYGVRVLSKPIDMDELVTAAKRCSRDTPLPRRARVMPQGNSEQ